MHPPASLVPADFPVRLLARAIDTVLLVAIDVGLGLMVGFGYGWLLAGAVIVLAYFVMFDTFAGTTPGKFALGLRVMGPEGGHPSLRQALMRESFTVLGAVPFVGPLLALGAWAWIALTIRSSPLRQGKHDLLAGGTRVIRSRPSPGRTDTAQDSEALLTMMRSMRDAELSVLDACLAAPGSHVTTSPGSQNDTLWSHMARLGWMTAREEVVDVSDKQIRMTIYSITAQGVERIAHLLETFRKTRRP
jgi:uncharacterized RDD family membrane protein YckC